MGAPGVIVKETAARSLSVQAGATALPVFIGKFKTKDELNKLEAGQCIPIHDWLSFSQKFTKVAAEVKFAGQSKAKGLRNRVSKSEAGEVGVKEIKGEASVFKGEAFFFEIVLNQKPADDGNMWVALGKVEKEAVKDARLIVGDRELVLEFASSAGGLISASAPLPKDMGNVRLRLKLETKTEEADFSIKAAVSKDRPEGAGWQKSIAAKVVPVDGNVEADMCFNYYAIQHYFQNGGGPCYLLPLLSNEESELSELPKVIQTQAPDAALLVCLESGEVKKAVYSKLDTLLKNQQGYFLIADSQEKSEAPNTTLCQTASYYPALLTDFCAELPADIDITLDGYKSNEGKKIATLDGLKVINPDAHAFVVEKLATQFGNESITLPASAAVAGCYARNDRERGVWKAPANIELHGVQAPSVVVTNEDQDGMNAKGINAIRAFNGRGTLIWGTRTLDVDGDDWRYIPVRRLFNSVERDIKKTVQVMMFEPNNQATWERVRGAIDNYLRMLWRQGALQGNSEQEAYVVKVGKGVTMDKQDIQQGKMIIEVGMAAVRPAEFILLQFSQNMQ
ncbi:phage tail sheath family protein [Chromobacterium haemolyticum]|uniref:phage tail sheath family protein n=1 Tax=Chromobacterium haemolyticum TaxID=394935 RepID=UPI0009D93CFE|nr:phage tail sheath C-terminal domain-containing protein [Chromobacterium haemolyticum]OQS37534.1 hypothetical protein B0T39_15235 [Chromobacterium haemolyticum]